MRKIPRKTMKVLIFLLNRIKKGVLTVLSKYLNSIDLPLMRRKPSKNNTIRIAWISAIGVIIAAAIAIIPQFINKDKALRAIHEEKDPVVQQKLYTDTIVAKPKNEAYIQNSEKVAVVQGDSVNATITIK